MAEARRRADVAERAWLQESLAPLLRGLAPTSEGCGDVADLSPASELLFRGYVVELVVEGDRCVARVEPELVQHRRRFRGVVGPQKAQAEGEPGAAPSTESVDTQGTALK